MKKIITFLLLVVSLKVSAQSGITWNMGMNIAANTYGNMHPRMALDKAGNPLVIWGKMADKSVYFSRWNGAAFTTPVKLNPAWMSVATASWMGPDIAAHGDTVYVVVKRVPENSDTNYTYIMRSFDGGQNFSAPTRIDNIADSMSRFPTVTTNASGNPVVAFMKFNAAFLESRWVVTKSTDYGNTFSPDVKASGWGASAEVCDCCPGAVLSVGNTVAMLYRNNNNNIRDTWLGLSTNGGASFTNGFAVDNNNWMLMSCPSSGPDAVVYGDSMYTVHMNGAGGMNKVYLSRASLSAGANNTVTSLATGIAGLTEQNFPRIANYGTATAIVWKQTVSGGLQLPILFTNNILNGFPAVYDTVDMDNITNADVAVANGIVFVVWQDDNSGTVKYRSGTFSPFATGIKESLQEKFSISPNPASTYVNLQVPNENFSVTVSNIFGQQIFSKQYANIKSDLQLNIADWSCGAYFFTLKTAKGSYSQKIIKQ